MTYAEAFLQVRNRRAAELLVLWRLMGFSDPLPVELQLLTVTEPEKRTTQLGFTIRCAVAFLSITSGAGQLTNDEWALLMSSETPAVRETAVRQFHMARTPCR